MKLLEKINVRGTTVLMVTHAKDIVDKMNKRVVAIDHGRIVRDEEGSYGFVQQTEPEEDLYVPGFTTFLDPNELRAAQAQINRKNERARGRTSAVNDPVGYDDSLVNTYLDGGEDVYE
jgi:ABC-type methionine transport system ATPase subunit